jgi:cystathionine beta-lyase
MARDGDRYVLDFDAAEAAMDPSVRILIFCAPQNPSGRVWTADELRAVAEFAARHDLIVISDEIHSDLIYPGAKACPHGPGRARAFGPHHHDKRGLEDLRHPGLRTGYAIIPDPTLRAAYQRRLRMTEYSPGTPGSPRRRLRIPPKARHGSRS